MESIVDVWTWALRQAELYMELGESREKALAKAAFLIRTISLGINTRPAK